MKPKKMSAARMAEADGWMKIDIDWWTKDGVGGVTRENDGKWYFWPKNSKPARKLGPRSSMTRAMALSKEVSAEGTR